MVDPDLKSGLSKQAESRDTMEEGGREELR